MDDSISRQAAIEIVDRYDKSHMILKGKPMLGAASIVIELEDLPSAQPEIIRCKDCKYITEHYDTDGNVPYWTCSEWDSRTDYDGFCHYAERRTDDSISEYKWFLPTCPAERRTDE